MPNYVKLMKEIISMKRRLGDNETVALTEECSFITTTELDYRSRSKSKQWELGLHQ